MADQPLIDISPDNWQVVRDILERYVPDREVWAFGSRAKWTAKEFSDLDIAIIGDEPMSIGVMAELNESFQESVLPFKVDVVDWAAITPSFRQEIEAHKVLLSREALRAVSPAPIFPPAYEIEWKPFTDLLSTIIDNRGRTCPIGDSGIPLIATNCIDSENLYPRYDTTRYVSAETYQTWFRGHPKSGDILFVCKGSPGRTNWTPDPVDFCIAQDMVAVRADPKKIYPRYLFAALRSSVVLSQIDNMHVGTMIPHFKKGDFDKLNIPVPDKKSQHEIGDFYFVVSERIDLIRKTNATLEAIAQALFKSWFVDFDPVRAKTEGREPEGLPPEIAELFPNEFEDSELGPIPKGWRASRLDEACEINPTRRITKSKQASYLEMAALPTKGHRPETPTIREFSSGTKFINGDTLLARITPCLENGKSAFVDFLQDGEVAWGSTEYIVLRPKVVLPCYWAYLLSRHEPFRQFAIQAMVGTSGRQRVEVSRLAQYLIVVPDDGVGKLFATMIEPIQQLIAANDDSAKSLATMRDTLLPKLMSGRLRIEEIVA